MALTVFETCKVCCGIGFKSSPDKNVIGSHPCYFCNGKGTIKTVSLNDEDYKQMNLDSNKTK